MVPETGGIPPACLDSRPSCSRAVSLVRAAARKSRFFAGRAAQCGKSLAGSGGQRRRSHGSCGATPPLEAAVWSIARRQRIWHAERAARRPKQGKLAINTALRAYVEEPLAGSVCRPSGALVPGPAVSWKGRRHGWRKDWRWANAWSPEQIARRLPVDFPDDDTMRISHEAIYQALFVPGPERVAVRSSRPVCASGGRSGGRGREYAGEARPSSLLNS